MKIQFVDSASQPYRAELLMHDPKSGLADLEVPLESGPEELGFSVERLTARRVPYDPAGAPYTWRKVA